MSSQVEAGLQQHLFGVLAEFGGNFAGARRGIAEAHRRRHHGVAVHGAT